MRLAAQITVVLIALVVAEDADMYPGTSSFTVMAWVRTTQTNGRQAVAAHRECGDTCPATYADPWIALRVRNGRASAFVRDATALGPDSGGQTLTGTSTVADGRDHLLALTRDSAAERLSLFVDGLAEAQAPLGPGTWGAIIDEDGLPDPFTIGADRASGSAGLMDPFDGTIDEVAWHSASVSASTMTSIADAGAGGMTTDDVRPTSNAVAPASSTQLEVPVHFLARDDGSGRPNGVADPSGLASVRLDVRPPGQPDFTAVATDESGSLTGAFSYVAPGPGRYEFRTVATDVAGNVELAVPTADAITVVGASASPSPASPAPGDPAATADPPRSASNAPRARFSEVVTGLPSARRCLSRRTFRIRVRAPKGRRVVSVSVRVGARRPVVRAGAALRAAVDLRHLPRGRFVVRITVRFAGRRPITATRRYRTCAARTRGG